MAVQVLRRRPDVLQHSVQDVIRILQQILLRSSVEEIFVKLFSRTTSNSWRTEQGFRPRSLCDCSDHTYRRIQMHSLSHQNAVAMSYLDVRIGESDGEK